MTKRVSPLPGTANIAAVKDDDLIIEAVFEEMAIKKDVFAKLDTLARADASAMPGLST